MAEITKADRDLAQRLFEEAVLPNMFFDPDIDVVQLTGKIINHIAALFAKQREGWIEMLEQEKYSMPDTSLEVGYNEGLEAAIEILGGRP